MPTPSVYFSQPFELTKKGKKKGSQVFPPNTPNEEKKSPESKTLAKKQTTRTAGIYVNLITPQGRKKKKKKEAAGLDHLQPKRQKKRLINLHTKYPRRKKKVTEKVRR